MNREEHIYLLSTENHMGCITLSLQNQPLVMGWELLLRLPNWLWIAKLRRCLHRLVCTFCSHHGYPSMLSQHFAVSIFCIFCLAHLKFVVWGLSKGLNWPRTEAVNLGSSRSSWSMIPISHSQPDQWPVLLGIVVHDPLRTTGLEFALGVAQGRCDQWALALIGHIPPPDPEPQTLLVRGTLLTMQGLRLLSWLVLPLQEGLLTIRLLWVVGNCQFCMYAV